VFGILREKNPELTGERRRTVLKPPQVAREGTKKTVFTNFMDLCKVGGGARVGVRGAAWG
jgi:translation initiation factor 2 subunit 2